MQGNLGLDGMSVILDWQPDGPECLALLLHLETKFDMADEIRDFLHDYRRKELERWRSTDLFTGMVRE